MSPEDLMAKIGHLVVERYAELVIKIDDTADQRSDEAQLKMLGRVSMEGGRVNAFQAQGRKLAAGLAKLDADLAKASQAPVAAPTIIANENDVEAPEEMEMDDDTGRTPERIDALYHEIDRRLAALAARREAKGWGARHASVEARSAEGDPAVRPGPAPDAPA